MFDDGRETAIAKEMIDSTELSDSTRRYHELTPFMSIVVRTVRARTRVQPITPTNEWGVREEIVIQIDYCFMTTVLVVCVAICKGVRDVLGVKTLTAFAISLDQSRLVRRSTDAHSSVELFRQTCDEPPRQQLTLTTSKGSIGRVEQTDNAIEYMTKTTISCVTIRHEKEVPTTLAAMQWTIRMQFDCWNVSHQTKMTRTTIIDSTRGISKV